MKAKEIIELMNDWALPILIDHWDNTGFQIGDENKEVNRILVALDLDMEVYEKAVKEDFDMIITHHPLIFKPISSITTSNYKGKLIHDLIRNEIVIYNAHTNLDQAENGVNDELAKLLELCNPTALKLSNLDFESSYGYGKVGDIKEIELVDYIKQIKEKLNTDSLIVYGNQERKINRVAICGGSGSEFIYDAYKQKACIYITGDIKYHDAQLGAELGLTIIDAGHYHTEKVILPVIKEYLEKEKNCNIYVEIWERPSPLYKIY
ncbi:Nif3-like dinuclear metal center hexameric protein [Tissierella carlieri]|uniref:Nif3-like dinuclear metal center hexameric protein n=1 Tax=Tissierella TaxID=41273 RepID=UPI000B9FD644|nr:MULTISPECIES: Nif3-like dinuclear metal center hexameric protein [Tissierella]MBU5313582.1 Nif3-like dinuclear metal center hexameric protein [Tissierella carlieri]MDU5080548.1 Nif3-like dinuclear metal center hexameric protein [Bacillota bacterium]OZV13647.1 Nif3-like dinuclear metal center hexameric protein [Tissierella sp. P1]